MKGLPLCIFTFPVLAVNLYFGNIYDFSKRCCIADCELCQHLSIDSNSSFLQSVHHTAVGQTVYTGSCIYSGDPKLTEVSFVVFSMSIRIAKDFRTCSLAGRYSLLFAPRYPLANFNIFLCRACLVTPFFIRAIPKDLLLAQIL